nr:MAG TPA: hypothetical protein [Caudoviricetes sp.]
MTKIPEETKKELKDFGENAKFTYLDGMARELNGGIFNLVKKAVGNKIADDQPYTFRINFRNGRIVGETFDPRFSVEKLEGRTPTTEFDVKNDSNTKYYEYKTLNVDYKPSITNGDSWVVRIKEVDHRIVEVTVNPDFNDPEDRKLIKDTLMHGFKSPEMM